MPTFIDSHAHIFLTYSNINEASYSISNYLSKNINAIINVSLDFNSYLFNKKLFELNNRVFYTAGLYPSYAEQYNTSMKKQLNSSLCDKNVIAIGECGIDYFRNYATPVKQIKLFEEQVILAKELNLPIIVHTRDSFHDVYKILAKNSPLNACGVMHCYSGDSSFVKRFLDLGFFISFAGNVTYKKSDIIRQSVKHVPLTKLLIETDSPYLAPVPFRGKTNSPLYLQYTAKTIADIKQCSLETIASNTSNNAIKLFKLNLELYKDL